MPRYDQEFSGLIERVFLDVGIDIETFIERAVRQGMGEAAIIDRLLLDLETDGPIFGKFLRGAKGAGAASTLAAVRQGEVVAAAERTWRNGTAAERKAIARLAGVANMSVDDLLATAKRDADPEIAAAVESAVEDDLEMTSIAEMRNTCYECLPLHGKSMTLREWREAGMLPEMRHSGWTTPCRCRLVPSYMAAADRSETVAPLVRTKIKSTTGLAADKKTVRSVLQKDTGRAIEAVEKARQTPEGRRALRLLGMATDLEES